MTRTELSCNFHKKQTDAFLDPKHVLVESHRPSGKAPNRPGRKRRFLRIPSAEVGESLPIQGLGASLPAYTLSGEILSMPFSRSCGILLHPTCLPGPHGIGSIGAEARKFVDWLAGAGQGLWQVCPLGPTGFGDSPYQCFSAFAGNPMLIDLNDLAEMKLLHPGDFDSMPPFSLDRVDFGPLIEWKNGLLKLAFERFKARRDPSLREEFAKFNADNQEWLDDFSLFMALKEACNGAPWTFWEPGLVQRKASSLADWRGRLGPQIERRAFDQFLFFRQWNAIKSYANARGIKIVGDAPIFVAHDSADVWANPNLFYLDKSGYPSVVAGVPPDYFSATGQRWGNPLYKWPAHQKTGFAWWIKRFRTMLQLVDIVRIDHFRGFESYWEIPASEETAVVGRWVKSPGESLFKTVARSLGTLPLIAEDLGVITPEVDALRLQFEFPGMKVLQFGFDVKYDATNVYLPHNFEKNCVAYSGTHDNDTTLGWYREQSEVLKDHVRRYCWCDGSNVPWDFIRLAYMSSADLAIIPLTDVIGCGSEGRFNFPGRPNGNWTWRYRPEVLTSGRSKGLEELARMYGRMT